MGVGGRPDIRATLSPILLSTVAHAHIPIPNADIIAFEPGNPRHAVMESASYGFFETQDGGATFSYTCRAAYSGSTSSDYLDRFVLMPDGFMAVAAGFDGLHVALPGLCGFTKLPGMPGSYVGDVVTSPAGDVVYVLSSEVTDASSSSFISRSVDGLRTLHPTGALPPGVILYRIAIAASDERRMYAAGYRVGNTKAEAHHSVFRSRDAAVTWEEFPAPDIGVDASAYFGAIVVSPVDSDVLFLVATLFNDVPAPALWASFDGGATLIEIPSAVLAVSGLAVNQPLPGVAFSPDGTELLFGGSEGLWHVDVSALRRGAEAVEKYSENPFRGLTWTPDGLYAGGWQFGSDPSTQFTIGVSRDGGRHFSPLFDVCDTVIGCGGSGGPPECGTLVDRLRVDFMEGPACTLRGAEPFPIVDGGVRDAGSIHRQNDVGVRTLSRGPGCACSVGSNERAPRGIVALLAAVAALTARSRSKRPRARCSSCRFGRSRESPPSRRC